MKVQNNKAWWLVLPVFLLVAFSAIVPMMTVVNYSVQDIFDPATRYFVGVDWYRQVLQDPRLHDSLLRQFIFSACVLLIQIPLGIAIALCMPTRGRWASLCLQARCPRRANRHSPWVRTKSRSVSAPTARSASSGRS